MSDHRRRLLLAIAYLAATLGPFVHELDLAREMGPSDALAAAEGVPEVDACCHDPGCTDLGHRHHTHRSPHDPASCTLCQSFGLAGMAPDFQAPPAVLPSSVERVPDSGGLPLLTSTDLPRPRAPPAV